MERLIEKYPEFEDQLKGHVLPEEVLDAEIRRKEEEDYDRVK